MNEEEKYETRHRFWCQYGKKYDVVYDHNQHCHYEGELEHNQAGFQSLKKRIVP